jgi:hypothetical protein
MNTRNLWIASLTGAVLTTLVSNLPLVGFVNCLLCAGFWGSAIFAVWMYRRLGSTLTVRQGVTIGTLTGLCAGVLGFLLSFFGLVGMEGLMNSVGPFLPADATQGIASSLPTWGTIVFNLIGVIFNILFGTLGGFIGGSIFKTATLSGQNLEPHDENKA